MWIPKPGQVVAFASWVRFFLPPSWVTFLGSALIDRCQEALLTCSRVHARLRRLCFLRMHFMGHASFSSFLLLVLGNFRKSHVVKLHFQKSKQFVRCSLGKQNMVFHFVLLIEWSWKAIQINTQHSLFLPAFAHCFYYMLSWRLLVVVLPVTVSVVVIFCLHWFFYLCPASCPIVTFNEKTSRLNTLLNLSNIIAFG